jgi:hypothetical protein
LTEKGIEALRRWVRAEDGSSCRDSDAR